MVDDAMCLNGEGSEHVGVNWMRCTRTMKAANVSGVNLMVFGKQRAWEEMVGEPERERGARAGAKELDFRAPGRENTGVRSKTQKDRRWSKAAQGNAKVGGSGNDDVELGRSRGRQKDEGNNNGDIHERFIYICEPVVVTLSSRREEGKVPKPPVPTHPTFNCTYQRTILPITHGRDVIAKSSSTRVKPPLLHHIKPTSSLTRLACLGRCCHVPFNSRLVIPPPLQTAWGHRTVLLSCHAIRGNDGDSGQPHGFELP
ncbi:hypothetical protein EDB84DRAFT_1442540 [Lactarius hengduanensis]|nr:hypothetical protein EDB84DRAFT_1442540 [Lactarius hengduanensis]